MRKKDEGNDLKTLYPIILQSGLILSLLIFLLAFSYNMGIDSNRGQQNSKKNKKQQTIEIKDVVRTKQVDKPPQPPSPQPPKEVPNDEIISEDVQKQLDLIDQEMSSGGDKMSMPPPPEKEDNEERIHQTVEQAPKLIGGMDSLRNLIDYPNVARQAGIEGRVYIEFIVTKEGNVRDPKIVRSLGGGLDEEALRVLKKAKFRPGIQQGRPVNVRMTMPIIFRIGNE